MSSFKFAHMSDVHLGSWSSHPELRDLPTKAFAKALDKCRESGVDFIIIAGDLFDTSLPGMDILRDAAALLRKVREAGVRVYIVPGSHDYSPTGKSMIHVLESAGLFTNVFRYEDGDTIKLQATRDDTGAELCGVLGRRGSLEAEWFDRLRVPHTDGFSIFVMHCGVDFGSESNPHVINVPVSKLPKGFDYYASGHVHVNRIEDVGGSKVVFPGELFPTGFDELEDYDSGIYIITVKRGKINDIRREPVRVCDVGTILVNADGKTAEAVEDEALEAIGSMDLSGKILLARFEGVLKSGKPSDIDYLKIDETARKAGAYTVKKSTSKISAPENKEASVEADSVDEIEEKLIEEHVSANEDFSDQMKGDMKQTVQQLMEVFREERGEQTVAEYENRIKSTAKDILGL